MFVNLESQSFQIGCFLSNLVEETRTFLEGKYSRIIVRRICSHLLSSRKTFRMRIYIIAAVAAMLVSTVSARVKGGAGDAEATKKKGKKNSCKDPVKAVLANIACIVTKDVGCAVAATGPGFKELRDEIDLKKVCPMRSFGRVPSCMRTTSMKPSRFRRLERTKSPTDTSGQQLLQTVPLWDFHHQLAIPSLKRSFITNTPS